MTLKTNDLKNTISKVFEIDGFKSKMGSDEDIVVVSFSCLDGNVAQDLMNFIEKGYGFVLDADSTTGEQSDGTYKVFVEIQREKGLVDNIVELLDGVGKLSDIQMFRFRYYKNFRSQEASQENLQAAIPETAEEYKQISSSMQTENYKNFFASSYIEDVDMLDDVLTLRKKYAESLKFRFINFGKKEQVINTLTEHLNVKDFGEVIYLTKFIGDYNPTKYGNQITLENNDNMLVLERL